MNSAAIQYYNQKFGEDKNSAFIHLVREIGEIAFGLEKSNIELVKMEITESIALLQFLASKYNFDVESNIDAVYSKKLESQKSSRS